MNDSEYMRLALAEAQAAAVAGEVPVGAIIVSRGRSPGARRQSAHRQP